MNASGKSSREVWRRSPEHDTRFSRGDDYASDGWVHQETGEIKRTAVGHAPCHPMFDARALSREGEAS